MTGTKNSAKTEDFTSEVNKVHRVIRRYGNEILSYQYLVDIYENLTMVTGVIDRGKEQSTYKTSHGTLTLKNSELVRVKDGEIYEAPSGSYIINFMKGLLQTIATSKENQIAAQFNSVVFSVTKDDTVDTLCEKYDENREKIRAGLVKPYNS
jgi:hypothetical protein